MSAEIFRTTLAQAAGAVFRVLTDDELTRLTQHFELLQSWGKRINLTRIQAPKRAAIAHALDSLLYALMIPEGTKTVADFGSGAGFPGIPLAVALPDTEFVLVEPLRKRASFLSTVAADLGLSNVRVENERIESCEARAFDGATCRAVWPPHTFLDQLVAADVRCTWALSSQGRDGAVDLDSWAHPEFRHALRLERQLPLDGTRVLDRFACVRQHDDRLD